MPTTATTALATPPDALAIFLPEPQAEVMRLLWRAGRASVKQIHRLRAQQRDLAYPTTLAIVVGLAEQGVLARQREGLVYVYTPVLTEQAFICQRLADLLGAVERDYPAALVQSLDLRMAAV